MRTRLLHSLLIVAITMGGLYAWSTGRERSRLERRHAHLVGLVGDLPITDPSLVHVRALDTGDPLSFDWRVYLPPHYKTELHTQTGTSGSSTWSAGSWSEPSEFIAHVRLREAEHGGLEIFTSFKGSSSRLGFGDDSLATLLRGRWDKVRVEQLGASRPITLRPDQPAVLLRLAFSDELRAEARRVLPQYDQDQFSTQLFEVDLGTPSGKR